MSAKSINQLVSDGDEAGVSRMLDAGIPVDFIDNGRTRITPLQEAARLGNLAIATLLIEAGANVSHEDIEGFSPGTEATSNRRWEVAYLLANSGANFDVIDASGKTARHYLATRCRSKKWLGKFEQLIGPVKKIDRGVHQ